jgi:hypothetical protein
MTPRRRRPSVRLSRSVDSAAPGAGTPRAAHSPRGREDPERGVDDVGLAGRVDRVRDARDRGYRLNVGRVERGVRAELQGELAAGGDRLDRDDRGAAVYKPVATMMFTGTSAATRARRLTSRPAFGRTRSTIVSTPFSWATVSVAIASATRRSTGSLPAPTPGKLRTPGALSPDTRSRTTSSVFANRAIAPSVRRRSPDA